MPDRKLQCRVERCVQRIQLDACIFRSFLFTPKAAYMLCKIRAPISFLLREVDDTKKAIIGFRHAGDLLGKIIQFSTKARGCKDRQIPLKASSPPRLGLLLDFRCMLPFYMYREEKMVCGGRYHMKMQVSNHDKSLEISLK